jgi:amino acid transporter
LPTLATSTRPIADATARVLGAKAALIVSAGALVSTAGTLNTISLVSPRLLFAMADDGYLPRALRTVHPRLRTPHVAIIASAAIMLGFTLQGSFVKSAAISTIIRLVTYAATCAAMWRLRRDATSPRAPFMVPGGTAVVAGALLLTAWALRQAKWNEALWTGGAVLVGAVLFALVTIALRPGRRQDSSRSSEPASRP